MDMKEKKKHHAKNVASKSSQRSCTSGKGGLENAMYRYKGVRQRSWGKWVTEIHDRKQGKRHWLGSYDDASHAALIYDIAAQRLYGANAKLNLPEFWNRLAQCLNPKSDLNITQLTDNEIHLLHVLQKYHGNLMHPSQILSKSRVNGQNLPLANLVQPTECFSISLKEIISYENFRSSLIAIQKPALSFSNVVYDSHTQGVTEIANTTPSENNKNLNVSSGDNMREVWDNLNTNMPVVNNSIWDEAAMSTDFSSFTEFDFTGGNISNN